MENKMITMYELIGLIEDNKAPKKIKYKEIIFKYDEISKDYKAESNFRFDDTNYLFCYLFKHERALDAKVEILPEENDEWEDIEEILTSIPTKEKNEEGVRYFINGLIVKINQLIKNQKYLKERLDKDEQ